jgi:hypothetical protein
LNVLPFTFPITALPGLPVTGVVEVTEPDAAPLMKKYAVLLDGPKAHENARWVHAVKGRVLVKSLFTGPFIHKCGYELVI